MRIGVVIFLSHSQIVFAGISVLNSWTLPTHQEQRFEIVSQEFTRPLLVGDFLYVANNQGTILALKRDTGTVVWNTSVKFPINGAMSGGRSKLLMGDSRGFLTALNTHDGSVAWTFKINSEWLSPPIIQRDKVCASTSAEEIYCLSERNGKEIWHYAHRGDEKMTVRGSASPVILGDMLFQGFADGTLVALAADKGQVLWERRLRTRARFYDVDMPVMGDDRGIVVATFDGNIYSLNRNDGSTIWSFPVGSAGGFLPDGDRFYFSGLNGFFYAMDRASGTPIWKTATEIGHGHTPIKVRDFILFSTTGDPVYALRASNGEVAWRERLGAGTFAALTSSSTENSFYAFSNYGNVYAYDIVSERICRETLDHIVLPSVFWPHPPLSQCQI